MTTALAEQSTVIDAPPGEPDLRGGADDPHAIEGQPGAPSRHIDLTTAELDRYARTWLDLQQTRKALAQRELPDEIVAEFERLEQKLSTLLSRTLRRHSLWPWLSQFPGLGGAHTALIIGRIGDPRRYPGQRCSEGHYLPPLYAVGARCPVVDEVYVIDGRAGDGTPDAGAADSPAERERICGCPGFMTEPRTTTGVRSLWRWAGLDADADGRAPRKRRGVQGYWEPRVRASVMQPGGIAEQIVRKAVPYYADLYRTKKEQLLDRVAATTTEVEIANGDAQEGAAACRPLRLFEADRIARKVAAKAFLADLLTEWKRGIDLS